MSTIVETPEVYKWLRARTNALAPGGAWRGVAPDKCATPFIVYNLVSGLDKSGAAHVHLWQEGVYAVQVVGPDADIDDVNAVAQAVNDALDLSNGNTASATIIRCARVEDIEYTETSNGVQWAHVGARWLIYTRKK